MTQDVEFTVNAGDSKGKVYRYTLASHQGTKMWEVTPLFKPAPSMIKEKISMVIAARENNISRTGATDLETIGKIIEEFSIIAGETDVTLKGLDYNERPILIDQDGFSVRVTTNELGKDSEYHVTVACWGLYKV